MRLELSRALGARSLVSHTSKRQKRARSPSEGDVRWGDGWAVESDPPTGPAIPSTPPPSTPPIPSIPPPSTFTIDLLRNTITPLCSVPHVQRVPLANKPISHRRSWVTKGAEAAS